MRTDHGSLHGIDDNDALEFMKLSILIFGFSFIKRMLKRHDMNVKFEKYETESKIND